MSRTRRGLETLLALHADFRHDEMTAVARDFLRGQRGSPARAARESRGEVMVMYLVHSAASELRRSALTLALAADSV